MNPYKVLNSKPKDKIEQIKKRYRKLVNKHHPDKGGDPEKFHEIQKAWDMINNPEKITFNEIFGDNIKPEEIDEILGQLEIVFFQCLKEENPISVMIKTGNITIDKLKEQNRNVEKDIELLKSKKEKIHTNLRSNIFHVFLDKRIAQNESLIDSNLNQIEMYRKCLIVLDNFDFVDDFEYKSFFLNSGFPRKSINPIFFGVGS